MSWRALNGVCRAVDVAVAITATAGSLSRGRGWLIYATNAEKSARSLTVAMLLSTHSSKYVPRRTHGCAWYTRHRRDLPKAAPPPLSHRSREGRTRDTRTHRFLDVCFLVVRAHAALRTIPTTPSTHFHRLSPSLSDHPAAATTPAPPALRPRTLVQRAMQLPRRRLLLFPFFQFGWGAGSERATHSLTPFYFLAAFSPTLGPSPSPSYLHPLLRWPAEGKISIFICFFAGYVSPSTLSSRSYPRRALLPAIPSSASTFGDSLCLLYFLFLSHSSRFFLFLTIHLPLLTASRRGAARPRDRRGKRGWRSGSARETESSA